MQTIQPIATVSEHNPDQILFHCPDIPATGDFFLETFSSGLKLLVMNMDFSRPVALHDDNNPHTIGMSFAGKGKSEYVSRGYNHNSPVTPGTSGYFTYRDPVDTGAKCMPGYCQRVWVLMEPKTLTRLANEDEQAFAPFLYGLKHKQFHLEIDRLTPDMGRILQQIFHCPYQGKTRFETQYAGQWVINVFHNEPVTEDGSLKELYGKVNSVNYGATLTFTVK